MTGKLLAAVFCWVAFGLPSVDALAQGESKTIKIQDVPGVGNMLFRVAISKGYCERHGIKCELQMIPNAPLAAQALLAKNIDVATLAPEVQMSAMIEGAKIRAVAGALSLVPASLVIRNELPAPNAGKGYPAFMQDLIGKKIGVPVRGGGRRVSICRYVAEGRLQRRRCLLRCGWRAEHGLSGADIRSGRRGLEL